MSNQTHIESLQAAIQKLNHEPAQHWTGRIAKSAKVRRIQKKIKSLLKAK